MLYFVVSNMRPLNLSGLSAAFADETKNYTMMTRSPTSVVLRPHGNGIRSIVTEKIESGENILSLLGQSLERVLTVPKDQFKRMLKGAPQAYSSTDLDGYAHTLAGSMLLRSQLDCQDARLPRKTFDLKTRATLPIRMDVNNYKSHLGYRLTTAQGKFGSYEREYYDMCRSALIKYNFQVRIGNMDGIFVAYHNTAEIFGFQYLNREAMDECLFGNARTGDASFALITSLYNSLLDLVVPLYGADDMVRLTFSVNKTGSRLCVFSESILEKTEGTRVVPNATSFRQFALTAYSTVNSVRTDSVLLSPDGGDEWKLNYTLAEVQPDIGEFLGARAKAVDTLRTADLEANGMVSRSQDRGFFRAIEKSTEGALDDTREPVIAAWTRATR